MQREKTEWRKSELKAESCPGLARQSLAGEGHDEVLSAAGGRWGGGTVRRARGRQQCFLSSKRADNIASTAPRENSFCSCVWLDPPDPGIRSVQRAERWHSSGLGSLLCSLLKPPRFESALSFNSEEEGRLFNARFQLAEQVPQQIPFARA